MDNDYTNEFMNDEYTALSTYRGKMDTTTFFMHPILFKPTPTEEDYSLGRITRFFVKKVTSPNFPIYEVDISQYEEFEKNAFYKCAYLTWTISGRPYSIQDDNGNVAPGAYELNQNEILRVDESLPGVIDVLQNLLEFFIET